MNVIATRSIMILTLLLPTVSVPCQLDAVTANKYSEDTDWVETPDHSIKLIIRGVSNNGPHDLLEDEIRYDNSRQVAREGPVDVINNKTGEKVCTANIWLIYPPFAFANNRYFYFSTADAGEVWQGALDLKTCQMAWQSPMQESRPSFTKNSVVLGKKHYKIKDDCLPALKSVPLQPLPNGLD